MGGDRIERHGRALTGSPRERRQRLAVQYSIRGIPGGIPERPDSRLRRAREILSGNESHWLADELLRCRISCRFAGTFLRVLARTSG